MSCSPGNSSYITSSFLFTTVVYDILCCVVSTGSYDILCCVVSTGSYATLVCGIISGDGRLLSKYKK